MSRHHRLLSATLWFAACVGVGAAGFWLQLVVQPPLVNGMGLSPFRPLYLCALASLAVALYSLGWALFGDHTRLWHGVVFSFLGGCAGFLDGVYFAWLFGAAIGMISGAVVGMLVSIVRHLTTRAA